MKRIPKYLVALMMVLSLTFSAYGCGNSATAPIQSEPKQRDAVSESTIDLSEALVDSGSEIEVIAEASIDESVNDPAIDENGSYDSKEEVSLYIHIYDKLPSNYITKKEAKKLGWNGGSVEVYAPGMCIGGDYFGNYEDLLPDDQEYHECDIDTLGKKSRGAKRIIYSDDGYIYYTEDHYESFELLYEPGS